MKTFDRSIGQRSLLVDSSDATGAEFSLDGCYRYSLWRCWNANRPMLGFLMLNPSTADEIDNDPTIRRCIGYARDWGYGGIWVCNIFAYRSTDRSVLKHVDDPVGPDNDEHIEMMIAYCLVVVAAWGDDGILNGRSEAIMRKYGDRLHALKLNSSGEPSHPLYLKKSLLPFPLDTQE